VNEAYVLKADVYTFKDEKIKAIKYQLYIKENKK
jgi:hypothetical protein